MNLQHAILQIRPGQADLFEAAWEEAKPVLARQPGCLNVSLHRSLEHSERYLLLVAWETVAAHLEFWESADHGRWDGLLHGFYELEPTVDHYVAPGEHPSA